MTGGGENRLVAHRLVLLAAVPLFLMLALAAFLTVQFATHEREAQALVRHTYQVMAQLGRILDDARDAETGQRGFLLTGDARFLEPYRRARTHIETDLATFRAMTGDNPEQQGRARALEQMIRARLSAFDATLTAGVGRSSASPGLIAALDEGKRRMDALRTEVGRGMRAEQYLLSARERRRIETENLEVAFAIGAGVLILGILLMAAALLVRNNVSLEKAERARANEAAILQATLETVREGIAYFTSQGLLCAFNANFFTLLGLPTDLARIQHTQLESFQAVEAERGSSVTIFQPPRAGQGAGQTSHIAWAGRQLHVYKASVPTGGFLIGVVDQTERLQAEAIMRQAQKMEAIGHLTGGVAHDFNNLLQIISANLELAAGSAREPRLAERLQNAIGAVARGSRLTTQLLAFARRQALEPKSVDLGRVIRDMSEMLRRTLGETIAVETVIAGGLWNTLADPDQVESMLLNLAINARDAMQGGGKLTLEVANASLDDAYAAAHSEVVPGQYVMLAVTDTGCGMAPEIAARVFEPFFSTKPEGKGTGLGLAQAYGFTKQSGGHIKIYSEPGDGTTVKIYLPRTRREADAGSGLGSTRVEGGSEHVLVVEDDEGVRAAVTDMLTELGYRVSRAGGAEAALELLAKERPDLIFTDVVMPGPIPTREFTRQAQAMYPGLLVLYTSGYTHNAIVHNGKLDDDAALLSKPYRRDQLARKLREVFAGAARGAMPAPAAAPTSRGKVLVVEDVALIRMTAADMLEQIGFESAQAGDGAEALDLLRQDGAITILFTDLGLPGMSGRELVDEALKLKPGLKVVIASGYASPPDLPAGVKSLRKPFDMQQLRKALES
jgi:signal transduction histidine kinase/DNA-binding response OmpR family regulator